VITISRNTIPNVLPPKMGGRGVKSMAELNTAEKQIWANVQRNSMLGLNEVVPHEQQDTEIMLLAGGPSLVRFESDIKGLRAEGMPLVTTNGTYNWCLERGIHPGAQIILDARAFNKRFVTPVIDGCKYLLSSQCDASVIDAVPRDQVWLWHGETGQYIVPGGGTVMLRAIPLLVMLGFRKIHIYGFDSCLGGEDEHHAYTQPENDKQMIVKTAFRGRAFRCHGWMVSQAQEFCDMQAMLPDDVHLAVYGDGLIAHIIKSCAN
jgi:hypothetical protein